jgi:hypothetical protein
MKLFRPGVRGSLWLALTGCASSTPVAATRVVSANDVAFSTTPVCFVPPSAKLSSSEHAEQIRILEICQIAAQTQGVEVVPYVNDQCLAANMTWETRATDERKAECEHNLPGDECPPTGVHMKLLKLTLSRPAIAID